MSLSSLVGLSGITQGNQKITNEKKSFEIVTVAIGNVAIYLQRHLAFLLIFFS